MEELFRRIGALVAFGVFAGALYLLHLVFVFGNAVSRRPLEPSLSEFKSKEAWEEKKGAIRSAFEREVYGAFPKADISWQREVRMLDEAAYGGRGVAEEILKEITRVRPK